MEGAVKVGTIVQVSLSNVDTSQVDGANLTLKVSEVAKDKGKAPQSTDYHAKKVN